MGSSALQSNTTGGLNTALGSLALFSNNGSRNTAAGSAAMQANTSGNDNTATGTQALLSNNTGAQQYVNRVLCATKQPERCPTTRQQALLRCKTISTATTILPLAEVH